MNVFAQLLPDVQVLVAGDTMLDRYWRGAVERISPEAPVPIVRHLAEEDRLGGAANVALNVASLGARATLWTPAPCRTTMKLRIVSQQQQQQLLRVDLENDPHQLPAGAALPATQLSRLLEPRTVLVLSDYAKGALRDAPALVATARARGCRVIVDPKGDDYERYRGADLITPNRAEWRAVVGRWRSEADLAARTEAARQALGLGAVVLTRSEEGMTLFDARGRRHEPAMAREVFDVTGAGDTVVAALAVLVGSGMPARFALRHANAAAGAVVGRWGTALAVPADLGLGAALAPLMQVPA